MKRLLSLFVLLPLFAFGQEAIRIVAPHSEVRALSHLVSIDAVHGDTIIAYASLAELQRLESKGYAYTPLALSEPKALSMAGTIDELRQWNRYPTYPTYVAYMQQMAQQYPTLCHLDTIGTSLRNHLILCLHIHPQGADNEAPEFFYSSTIHGDELTGYYFMLRLIDTLLTGYANNEELRYLVDHVNIYINPLANPDGTYNGGDNSVQGAMRYNSNWVDLNRNYPDPFGTDPDDPIQLENTLMMDYVGQHQFRLSANLHGGSEVLNYPWDSFESWERRHPQWEWWEAVCKRFIDTMRTYAPSLYRDVVSAGYIEGGDWYVIPNGRQDYINYYHDCLEMTMEVSSDKKLSTNQLDAYWGYQHRSLINYIKELLLLYPPVESVAEADGEPMLKAYPSPTSGLLHIDGSDSGVEIIDMQGRIRMMLPSGTTTIDLSPLPSGIYTLRTNGKAVRVVKI